MSQWQPNVKTFALAFTGFWLASIACVAAILFLMTDINPLASERIAQIALGVVPPAGFLAFLSAVITWRRGKQSKEKHHERVDEE